MTENRDNQERERRRHIPDQDPVRLPPVRLNPRLVFSDPDTFFRDLAMS